MKFPTIVYKCPGDHEAFGGQTYSYVGVADEVEMEAMLKSGWFASLPEAVAGVADEDDDEDPTREELEDKARELGIKFDGRTSDATLSRRIEQEIG